MDVNSIITFCVCIIILFIIGRVFIIPLKKIFKIIINSIMGGMLIYIINVVGASVGFHIGLNVGTSAFVRNIRNSWSVFSNYIKDFYRIKEYKVTKALVRKIKKNRRQLTFVLSDYNKKSSETIGAYL